MISLRRAAFCLGLTLAVQAWASCSDDTQLVDAGACLPGDGLPCTCTSGDDGIALCGYDGRIGACDCAAARTFPCSVAGATFSCACASGRHGTQLCTESGDYSPCACDAPAHPALDAGGEPLDASAVAVTSCPAPFSCVEQMGYEVCADQSGLPPLCKVSAECARAGLPDAECIDPGVGGIKLCAQLCRR